MKDRSPLTLLRADILFLVSAVGLHALSMMWLPKVMYWRTFAICVGVSVVIYLILQLKKPGMMWTHALGRAWLLIPVLLLTMGESTLLNPRTGYSTRTEQVGMSYVLALLGFIMFGASYAKYLGEESGS